MKQQGLGEEHFYALVVEDVMRAVMICECPSK